MNKLQRCRAPIYEMLEQYRIMGNRSYHVPGHKNGEAYDGVEGAGFLDEVMKYDVTEISERMIFIILRELSRKRKSWQQIALEQRKAFSGWRKHSRQSVSYSNRLSRAWNDYDCSTQCA